LNGIVLLPSVTVDHCGSARQYVAVRHVVTKTKQKPLSEPVLLILTSLADEPRHGYALIKDIESLSEGRVRLSTGTLYGAIRRLVEDGLIEPFDQEDTSRDKQAYRLTNEGRKQLRVELDRMKQLTQKAAARLRTRRI
jgi:DNA-binding PadR family transcriptional regulator